MATKAELEKEARRLRARVKRLEWLCAEMYQVAGTANAPERVMDKLLAAAEGKPIPRVELLPISEDEFVEPEPA